MKSLTLANATDLNGWANRRDAQALLPQLIRRLVHATARRVIRAGFRAGEGVQLPGWDGIVVVEQGNAFVPDGSSAWELGTSNNRKSKADGDYEKRTAKPGEVEPSQSAFIFVTPRRWTEKSSWAAAREAEGKWHAVRAYDADDLEEWLELAPAVHVWLSVQLGKRAEGAIDLDSFWKDWSSVSQPEIPREFVLAGRAQVSEKVHEWLRSEDQTVAIKAGTREEALALFAATIQQLPESEQVAYFSRTIVVRNLTAWEQLTASEEPLILIPVFDSPDIVAHATRTGHRVLVPLGAADGESSKTVIAPSLNRSEARKALTDCGFLEARALELATLARRNLMSFRRKVSLRPEVHQPAWARPGEARQIIPALLAGRWGDGAEGDRDFLSAIAQANYESVNQTLVRWANETDPPVRNIAGAWFLTSKDDAWSLLARYLVPDDLRRFEEQVLIILGTPDPRFELSKEQRYMAALVGKTPRHSGLLQKEIADTLAFLGSRGEPINVTGGYSLSDWTSGAVRRLLDLANADWRVWASLSHELPLLAEAAPDVFLSAIEKSLTGSAPVLLRLFTEQENALFGRMYHTGVLWALETLAWNPQHLAHVASILTRLIQLVPAGNSADHVRDSLRGMFLLWHPQTKATLDQRLRVLDVIRERAPDVAWSLLKQLLPKNYDGGHSSAKPQWREWGPPASNPEPRADYWPGVKEIISRALTDVGQNGDRWTDLIWALAEIGPESYEEAVARLNGLDLSTLPSGDREKIWNTLRSFISQHRSYPDADWALPKEYVDRLVPVLERFEPAELVGKYRWLFDHSPAPVEGIENDYYARESLIETNRTEAVTTIYTTQGVAGLLELAGSVEQPSSVGLSVGASKLAAEQEDQILRDHLAAESEAHSQFARGFVYGRYRNEGVPWASNKLIAHHKEWTPAQQAQFLICLPVTPDTWDVAEMLGTDTDRAYWRLIHLYGLGDANVDRAAKKLLTHDRPHAAVELLSLHLRSDKGYPVALIAEVLERLIEPTPDDDRPQNSLSRNLSRLLGILADSNEIDESRVARLEWVFLPLLSAFERRPEILHAELGRRPEFFAEVVGLAFPPEGDDAAEVTDEDRSRARHAYQLLQSWRTAPGAKADGTIDGDYLKDWVRQARELPAQSGRLTACDAVLGEILSGAPFGEGGRWPHRVVAELIEDVLSDNLERGIERGLYNSRGVVMRNPFGGGDLEREIAARYAGYAEAARERWPRTAAMLRRIAKQYEAEGRQEDRNVELQDELGS